MELTCGPDGGVYVADWSDTGECHDSTGVHRTSGRIYKITHGEIGSSVRGAAALAGDVAVKARRPADLTTLSVHELVLLHTHANEWFSRQARLQLLDRAGNPTDLQSAARDLRSLFDSEKNAVHQLRALWSLHALGATDEAFLITLLRHPDEHLRTWAVRLMTDRWALDNVVDVASSDPVRRITSSPGIARLLAQQARTETSGLVRLALASALQRLSIEERIPLAAALVAHREDAADHNLPALIWYGLIPVADSLPGELPKLANVCELPLTRRLIARRLAEDLERQPAPVNSLILLATANGEGFQSDILSGLADGLAGWRRATKPKAWDAFSQQIKNSANTSIRERTRDLSLVFGDGRALDELKRVALGKDADMSARKAALQILIENRPPEW